MKIIEYPKNWEALLQRPVIETENLEGLVKNILSRVKERGDAAVKEYTQKFDQVVIDNLSVSEDEIKAAIQLVPEDLKAAIQAAKKNIETFHESQRDSVKVVETTSGINCWRKSVAIDKVGLYIPAGTAPLFSTVLMLGVPAKLAGCQEIILCSPPTQEGKINPVILYTASLVGCTQIFKVGGVQAIGAMASGTESIPKVYKIFGPGNQYVTCAKQLVSQQGVAIDMPAGPSELLVWADEQANPAFVAADLLSQAEHGVDSQVMLVSDNMKVVEEVQSAISQQIERLPRKDIAKVALQNSRAVVLQNSEEMIRFINAYAPEHLILNLVEADKMAEKITNAGSVFLGNFTPESLGDYASGTNHTLPTNGFACNYSGVSLDSFVKKITFQKASIKGLKNIGWAVELMAAAEELEAHKNAVSIRLRTLKSTDIKN
ncbi:histidinol dehydrogenase [Aureispira sp. CCB-E]|uniref:histidinol dehydrogenase n=1 Tax=Aureispira sp. CCB-E TaxID=3051121 RepID=UPI0028690628|nr:histidinol dehydrogenase [Aureispira sp. CCB-E]WMX12906.1 histidinol dehydrogenase [Aureispira sp. CCB-E]